MKNEEIKITAKCQQGRAHGKNALVIEINGKVTGYIQPLFLDFDRQHDVYLAYNTEAGVYEEFKVTHTLWDAMEFAGIPKNMDPELPNGCFDEVYDWSKHKNN